MRTVWHSVGAGFARLETLLRPDETTPIPLSRASRLLLFAAILTYVVLATRWSFRIHYNYATSSFDLGIFDQGVWLLSRFKDPFITVMGMNLMGDHTSFILFLLVPFYWLWPSPGLLLLSQSLALGLGAVPTFLLARWVARDERLALGVAVAYLVQPALAWINLEQFHPDSFEVPLALGAMYAMVRSRWLLFMMLVGLLLLVKEDVALFTVPLGLYVAVFHDRKVGLLTAGISLLYFFLAVEVILPGLNGIGTLDAWRIPFGGPGGLIRETFTHPMNVVDAALGPGRPLYLRQLFLPLALLPLLSPLFLTASGPLLSNLLSTFPYQHELQYHYTSLVVPPLVAAATLSIGFVNSRAVRSLLTLVLLVCAFWGAYLWGPSPWSERPYPLPRQPILARAAVEEAMELIPPDAPLSAVYRLVPHLTHREQIYDFPTPWYALNWGDYSLDRQRLPEADQVEYILLAPALQASRDMILLPGIMREGFEVIYSKQGVMLLKRTDGATTPPGDTTVPGT